jgi:hypothetical protein
MKYIRYWNLKGMLDNMKHTMNKYKIYLRNNQPNNLMNMFTMQPYNINQKHMMCMTKYLYM